MIRVNIGCGLTPTPGWLNFDNSPSIKLSQFPRLSSFLFKVGLINEAQMELIKFCKHHRIDWADCSKNIPLSNNSVDVLYSSHMLEHLDKSNAANFLKESLRVLKKGGVLRLALPNLNKYVNDYISSGDADVFMTSLYVCQTNNSFITRFQNFIVGPRHHQWMYDSASLSKLLINCGFHNPTTLKAGNTTISEPGNLNLNERSDESFYIEASKM